LEALLKKSAENQQEVTERLGYQVRRAVEVLVQTIDRIDKDRNRTLLAGVDEKELYQAALTVMMRLVFLFSAEERGLLLLGDDLYDQNYAVSTLRAQLHKAADETGEEVLGYRKDAWCRLLATFRAVHGGVKHEAMRLPAYGGALFDPDRFPFLEGRAPGEDNHSAHPLPVDNRTVLHLLEALQVLQVDAGKGVREARLLSFRALDIEQIGHVYEGLLDHAAVRADEPVLGLSGTKDKEPEVPLSRLEEQKAKGEKELLKLLKEETGRSESAQQKALAANLGLEEASHLRAACDNDDALFARVLPFAGLVRSDSFGKPLVITTGSVYVTQGTDRRATGTHYTPRSLTEPIVKRTLDPLLYRGMAEGVEPTRETLKTAKEILDLKVCDMATGSGAFLVQACRYLSERLVEAWEKAEEEHPGQVIVTPEGELSTGDPAERIVPADTDERLAVARRLIADRCLYGVDKNPTAVEMAKLSLWLITLQKDRPFTFLDHAIKCGDSLVGVDMDQLLTWSLDRKGQTVLRLFVEKDIKEARDLRQKLAILEELGIGDVRRKERMNAAAEAAMERVKVAADLIVVPSLAMTGKTNQEDARKRFGDRYMSFHRDDKEIKLLRSEADDALKGLKPFHWPLEFPEVFTDGRKGFDAILGNPPFQGGQKITGALGVPYREWLVNVLGRGKKGSADLVAYFYLKASDLLRLTGTFGLIATNTIAEGDTREVGLDQILAEGRQLYAAIRSMKWPGTANLEVAVAHVHNGDWEAVRVLGDESVEVITAFLDDGSASGKPFRLKANEGKSFIGSYVLGMGFVLEPEDAQALIDKDSLNAEVLFPYLNGENLNSRPDQSPSRWVIDFFDWPLNRKGIGSWTTADERERKECLRKGVVPHDYPSPVAADYPDCLAIVENLVRPEREKIRHNNTTGRDRADKWWKYGRGAGELYSTIAGMDRVLVRGEVSSHPTYSFVPSNIVFSHMLIAFAEPSFAHFSMMQSSFNDEWTRTYASRLGKGIRYTPSDCYLTLPLPRPDGPQSVAIECFGEAYHEHRRQLMLCREIGLTKTYNLFHDPACGDAEIAELRLLHIEMDTAVRDAYGWTDLDLGHDFYGEGKEARFTLSPEAKGEVLRRLLKLNHERAAEEAIQAEAEKASAKVKKPKRKSATPSSLSSKNSTTPVQAVAAAPASILDLDEQEPAAPVEMPVAPAQPTVKKEDIEPAILAWLVAREQNLDMVKRYYPEPIDEKQWEPDIQPLHDVRIAKELYAVDQMAEVCGGSKFDRQKYGPLSTTFYDSIDRAVELGWLDIRRSPSGATDYSIGQNAEEAVKLASEIIGKRIKRVADTLFYMEGDKTREAEQQTTIHKAWADLRTEGKRGTVEEVIQEVERWKPDRSFSGFSRGEILVTYEDLRLRGYIKNA
jgi:hypothetical protein